MKCVVGFTGSLGGSVQYYSFLWCMIDDNNGKRSYSKFRLPSFSSLSLYFKYNRTFTASEVKERNCYS